LPKSLPKRKQKAGRARRPLLIQPNNLKKKWRRRNRKESSTVERIKDIERMDPQERMEMKRLHRSVACSIMHTEHVHCSEMKYTTLLLSYNQKYEQSDNIFHSLSVATATSRSLCETFHSPGAESWLSQRIPSRIICWLPVLSCTYGLL